MITPGITASSIGDLLDWFGSSTFAAYSVRRFNKYSGFGFRIRRESDDIEADLYFDDLGETSLDSAVMNFSSSSSANNLGEFIAASGYTDADSLGSAGTARIVTWKDQSSNGRDVTNSTESLQPLLVDAGTLKTENGVVALDFYGDRLQRSSSNSHSQPQSYLAVAQSDATSGNDYLTDGDGSGGRQLMTHSGGYKKLWAASFGSSSESSDTNQNLWFTVFDGSDSLIHINGGSNVQTGNPGTQSQSGFTIGGRCSGTNWWDGRVQEIVHFSGDVSSTRSDMEDEVNQFYSIY